MTDLAGRNKGASFSCSLSRSRSHRGKALEQVTGRFRITQAEGICEVICLVYTAQSQYL